MAYRFVSLKHNTKWSYPNRLSHSSRKVHISCVLFASASPASPFLLYFQPTHTNLFASGPKYQLFHRSFILRSYMYHLCSVESPSHANWAANVSIAFPLFFPYGVVNNGEIEIAVCPLVHGLEIITDIDGLEC